MASKAQRRNGKTGENRGIRRSPILWVWGRDGEVHKEGRFAESDDGRPRRTRNRRRQVRRLASSPGAGTAADDSVAAERLSLKGWALKGCEEGSPLKWFGKRRPRGSGGVNVRWATAFVYNKARGGLELHGLPH